LSRKTEGDALAVELLPMLLLGDVTATEGDFDDPHVGALRLVEALRLLNMDRHLDELKSAIASAQTAGEIEERDRLVLELSALARRRKAALPKAEAAQTTP
jgi:hypothetical protein